MAPRTNSRHFFTLAMEDSEGRQGLSEREPYRFRDLADNRTHVVTQGETWQTIADRYYKGFPRPAGLWWVVADFQPEPPVDPTLALEAGATVIVPSLRTILEDVFNESRRAEVAQ